ncbi:MAG TPA: hypothetical protein VJW95_00545 [Dissulfurispiraceae bacterium]|nr:hypothetical protein [Dissulfurispiraceae bacterium]
MEGIGSGRLFIGALKLLSLQQTISYSSNVYINHRLGLGVTRPFYGRPVHRSDKQPATAYPLI